ncbi:MAG TPA: hypothetical protein VGK61_04275 [Planctomycetota bacterium]
MIRALLLAGLLLASQDPGKDPSEDPNPPPAIYTVIVTAKSQGLHDKDAFTGFKDRLKKAMPHLQFLKCLAVSGPRDALEDWRITGDARVRFDPAKLRQVFLDIKIQKMEIEAEGEAVTAEGKLELVCHYSGWRVALQPRKKREGEKKPPENLLDEMRRRMSEKETHFCVRGDIVATSTGYAIEVEECRTVPPPKPEKKKAPGE